MSDGTRKAAQDLVYAVDMEQMHQVAMRNMDAIEAATVLLSDVIGREVGPEDTDYGRGYIAGQQALARKMLEAIQREMTK